MRRRDDEDSDVASLREPGHSQREQGCRPSQQQRLGTETLPTMRGKHPKDATMRLDLPAWELRCLRVLLR